MSADSRKFLGMTRDQFVGVLLACLLAVCGLQGYVVSQQNDLAAQGAQSHAALCVLRADYVRRVHDSRVFLKLTPEQRVRKYGQALGTIPADTVRRGLVGLESDVRSLSDLNC